MLTVGHNDGLRERRGVWECSGGGRRTGRVNGQQVKEEARHWEGGGDARAEAGPAQRGCPGGQNQKGFPGLDRASSPPP